MRICQYCNSYIDKNITYCPICGKKNQMTQISLNKNARTEELDDVIVIEQKSSLSSEGFSNVNINILHTPEIDDIESSSMEPQNKFTTLEIVPERRYWIWFVLGILSIGLIFLVYLFLNIEDLERHSYYPVDIRAEPINVNTSQTMIIFIIAICFGFIPILWWIYFKKFASLYFHIKKQKQEIAPRKIPHPVWYMIPLVLSHLTALIPTIISFTTKINVRIELPGVFWSLLVIVLALTSINLFMDYLWQRAFNAHLKMTMVRLNLQKDSHKMSDV